MGAEGSSASSGMIKPEGLPIQREPIVASRPTIDEPWLQILEDCECPEAEVIVMGAAQVGKTLLINQLLGLPEEDESRWAKVGGGMCSSISAGLRVTGVDPSEPPFRRFYTSNRSLCMIDTKGLHPDELDITIRDIRAFLRGPDGPGEKLRACVFVVNEKRRTPFDSILGYKLLFNIMRRTCGVVVVMTDALGPGVDRSRSEAFFADLQRYHENIQAQVGNDIQVVRVNSVESRMSIPGMGWVPNLSHGLEDVARAIVEAVSKGSRPAPKWGPFLKEANQLYAEAKRVSRTIAHKLGAKVALTPGWGFDNKLTASAWVDMFCQTLDIFRVPDEKVKAKAYFEIFKEKFGALTRRTEGTGRIVAGSIPIFGWVGSAIGTGVKTADALIGFGDQWCDLLLNVFLAAGPGTEETLETYVRLLDVEVENWGRAPGSPV